MDKTEHTNWGKTQVIYNSIYKCKHSHAKMWCTDLHEPAKLQVGDEVRVSPFIIQKL